MILKEIFSERIKTVRLQNNISQKTFGELFGLSKQAVSDIERGYRMTTIEKLVEISDHFNISIDYLVGRSDDPSRH